MTDRLLWGLLGGVIFPLWLLAGLVDYALHQRTSIATTSGEPESRLHLVQALEVGGPVLLVLFFELNLLVLALAAVATIAHTITAYRDISYASSRRVILPLEQVVHSFLLTLPMFATALLVLLYWTTAGAAGDWALRLRDPPWPAGILVGVLGASMLLGLLPGLAEWWQTRRYAPAVSSPEGTDHAAGQSGQPG